MKKIAICLISLVICNFAKAQGSQPIKAAMGKIHLEFSLDADGRPVYSVSFGEQPVIKPSHMGLKLLNDSSFDAHFQIIGTERKTVDETW
jgi:glucan 1,4-alpha-glucosidase